MQQVLVEQDSGFWCGAECREADAMLVQVASDGLGNRHCVHLPCALQYTSKLQQCNTLMQYTGTVQ